jgi:tetratricopeptide (TPR) repeat protein
VFNIMKIRALFILAVMSACSEPERCWAVGNPVGSSTAPPSSSRSGLVRSPNPIDTSGNLIVTGNVGGGRHFRGVVPYNAISDFGGRLGSSSVESFLRSSANSGDFGRYTGRYSPYYSPRTSVTTTNVGTSGVGFSSSSGVRIDDRIAERYGLPSTRAQELKTQDSGPRTGISDIQLFNWSTVQTRPMSLTPQELDKMISSEVWTYPRGGEVEQESSRAAEQQSGEDKQADGLLNPRLKMQSKLVAGYSMPGLIEFRGSSIETQEPGLKDVYEQMIRQAQDSGLKTQDSRLKTQDENEMENANQRTQGATQDSRLKTQDSRQGLGSYSSFASISQDKFNQYISSAERYLKQGKYYRAADAYTMASIYKPNDPLAYAGKSHALFAAGEYMSSALFLSRALRIFPEYAHFKIGLVAMIPDIDKLESRIVDVEQWQKRNGSTELQFLLAYVYYQMDRLEQAKKAIDSAFENMPAEPAVSTLKKAIDDAIAASQQQVGK